MKPEEEPPVLGLRVEYGAKGWCGSSLNLSSSDDKEDVAIDLSETRSADVFLAEATAEEWGSLM